MNPLLFIVALVTLVGGALYAFTGSHGIKFIADKLPKRSAWPTRPLVNITDITIHHSAGGTNQSAYDFARYHVDTKGWPGIGYHYVIDYDGNIFQTNNLYANSYHNGYNNSVAVGICLVGDFTKIKPSGAQVRACNWLVKRLKQTLPNVAYLNGHKEYATASTLCPGSYPVNDIRKNSGLKIRSGFVAKSLIDRYNGFEADN